MGRFSPDTALDALMLPWAMTQFKGNIYTETIAPDLRPAALLVVLGVAAAVAIMERRRIVNDDSIQRTGRADSRPATAFVTATLVSLMAWIFSSGNGRYGLLPITLCAIALMGAISYLKWPFRWSSLGLLVIIVGQLVLLGATDPNGSWNGMIAGAPWKGAAIEKYEPVHVERYLQLASRGRLLVINSRRQTGMALIASIFGPKAHYLSLTHVSGYPKKSPYRTRALALIGESDTLYLARVTAAKRKLTSVSVRIISNPLQDMERSQLRKLGLEVNTASVCEEFPIRMGSIVQLCPLQRFDAITEAYDDFVASAPASWLSRLAIKCPKSIGNIDSIHDDQDAGVYGYANDEKYFIAVRKDLSVHIKHRTQINSKKILSREELERLEDFSCWQILNAGRQYWH